MATEIRMPQLGLTMTEGMIGEWLKKEGDVVQKGDALLQITTDKLATEIESEADGVLRVIYAKEGDEVPVQGLLAIVGSLDEEINIDSNSSKTETIADVAVQEEQHISPTTEKAQRKRIKASPLAKKTATKLGIDLSGITGSGFSGRIVQKDVLAQEPKRTETVSVETIYEAVESPDVPTESADVIKPLTSMRKVIGKRMTESKHNAPHVTLTTEANVDKTILLRSKLNDKNTEVRLSYTDILVKMIATTLRHIPMMNTSIEEDRIIIHDKVNIGVAVALEEGLLVPVVRDADRKGFKAISKEIKDLAARAKENKLSGDELMGGTFTISNLGNYDVDGFTPIINLPESAILGVGRIVRKPVVNENDEIVPASMMTLSLSFDHRVADGALAAQLLKMIKDYLEDPDQMYL
ncbi:pyruvate dehydrogenase E2 component (dihydrolipoamide acetyltransferase) [Anaerovirgula multivorans]|uniref:Dihydrolipoamide acetyltransferase component of pyruvate dehydrogenase complex n=1 Tax=Anaerovirgula multivorans TaxID=312168 RepID=A0A239JWA8_9FIRM|nr:dihydrolipoamide acetyltransferase family protein [Anaerovirgula multivorans]SNT09693.1 pyruvate dehydrogenase E2 component (dihydrolipoamide acetyltransferase) [Anaerovirgula multivorans]